uniref:hypothetical protein n=1 Tax=Antarcticibacterium arcticum TaxID=2585771 RepID=UPI003742CECF
MYDAKDRLTSFTNNNSAKTQTYDNRGMLPNKSAKVDYLYSSTNYQQNELNLNTR